MTNIEAVELKIKELEKRLKGLDYYSQEYIHVEYQIKEAKEDLIELKEEIKELGGDQQTSPNIPKKTKPKKKIKPENKTRSEKKSKKEKREEKLKKALEAGARIAERSLSKVSWDIAHKKIKVVSGKLDYRSYQILNCASDKIAQNEWFSKVLFPEIIQTKTKNNESKLVIISAKEFKDYIDDQTIPNKNLIRMFEDLPEAILKGRIKIPFYYPKYEWVAIDFYKDNICGVAIAHIDKGFEGYRSKRKLRGEGSGREEPVFILIFSNAYGQAFFENARKREACQLVNQKLYKLDPNAQELFQAVRWNEGLIIMNVEEVSRAVGWVWPPKDIYDRIKRCQKLINILYKKNFINKPIPRGKSVKEKSWLFYISKGRGSDRKQLIKNCPTSN